MYAGTDHTQMLRLPGSGAPGFACESVSFTDWSRLLWAPEAARASPVWPSRFARRPPHALGPSPLAPRLVPLSSPVLSCPVLSCHLYRPLSALVVAAALACLHQNSHSTERYPGSCQETAETAETVILASWVCRWNVVRE